MKLCVLGKYGPFPPSGGATSGYLLSEGDTNILIECGSGIVSRVQRYLPLNKISAIILSHLHGDRTSDIAILRYALAKLQAQQILRSGPIKIFAPNAPKTEHDILRSGQNVFELIDISDGMRFQLGAFTISFQNMRHPIPSYGLSAFNGERTFVYTGDTCYHDGIVPFARNADVFLCDVGAVSGEKQQPVAAHLTSIQGGAIAKEANVKRLICTNLQPFVSENQIRLEAAYYFPGAEIAQEMHTYYI